MEYQLGELSFPCDLRAQTNARTELSPHDAVVAGAIAQSLAGAHVGALHSVDNLL